MEDIFQRMKGEFNKSWLKVELIYLLDNLLTRINGVDNQTNLWFRLFLCTTAQVETGYTDGGNMLVVNEKKKKIKKLAWN